MITILVYIGAIPEMYRRLGPLFLAPVVVCLILSQFKGYSPLHGAVTRHPISGELNESHQIKRYLKKFLMSVLVP